MKKRKVEEVEAAKADREAKALKREMRRKGHVVSIKLLHFTPSCKLLCRRVQCTRSLPRLQLNERRKQSLWGIVVVYAEKWLLFLQTIPKKGQDPQHDIKEKALARIGTRYKPLRHILYSVSGPEIRVHVIR